jgi:hypothetical protein
MGNDTQHLLLLIRRPGATTHHSQTQCDRQRSRDTARPTTVGKEASEIHDIRSQQMQCLVTQQTAQPLRSG